MRSVRRDERGQAGVELALVAMFLLTLAIGIVEFTHAVYTRIGLQEAVQDAVIYASYHPTDPAGAQNRGVEASSRIPLTTADLAVTCPGSSVRVTATYHHPFITGFLAPVFGPTLPMTSELVSEVFSSDPCVPS